MSMRTEVTIRLATKEDIPTILHIVKEAFIEYCQIVGITSIEALCETEADVQSDLLDKNVYVACRNGEILGTARIAKKEKKAILSRFAILPQVQGAGIGSALLIHIEKELRSSNIERIELYSALANVRLKDYYLGKGFEIQSTSSARGYERGVFQKEIGNERGRTTNE